MPFVLVVVVAFVGAMAFKWRPSVAAYVVIAAGAAAATLYFMK
jgi:hypothetical protein